jgi:hypothetical protein
MRLLGALALLTLLAAAPAQKKKDPAICLREDKGGDCPCIRLHPDLCQSDEPLPNCCKATEGKAVKHCECCPKKK